MSADIRAEERHFWEKIHGNMQLNRQIIKLDYSECSFYPYFGQYGQGAVEGVHEAGRLLARHYPPLPGGRDEDELPNRPAEL